jgi:hypothetical protein
MFAILVSHSTSLPYFTLIFGEDVERRFRGGPVRHQADLAQVLLHFRCTESGTLSSTFTVLCNQDC